jgi:hypothetical protein
VLLWSPTREVSGNKLDNNAVSEEHAQSKT